MPTPVTLTVAIPTYNRADTVARRVREFVALGEIPGVELLVVDNASTDGTYSRLESEFAQPNIRILRNSENIGYSGNFLRLITETSTEYLTVMSDEDRLNGEGFQRLLEFCAAQSPRMVSPRAQVGTNEKYRGRATTREIDPSEFENASFYLSGLTYEASAAREYASLISGMIATNSAANIYPQVLLTALAVASGKAHFLDALVSTQLEQLATHIVEENGGEYFTVPGRWSQFVGYEDFFNRDFSAHLDESGRFRLEQMRQTRRSQLLPRLNKAAIAEFPELKEHFARACTAKRNGGFLSRLLRR
jgi:glycosyltransferase involved in cell wall biosynthesis